MAGNSKKNTKEQRTPLLEWVAAGLGLAVVLGMFAFLILEALAPSRSVPPLMRIEPVNVAAAANQYVVEVKVSNRSGQTAAGVQIEGVLKQGGTETEKSNSTIDYVPGKSERHAGLVFTRDPRQHQVELRVTGYQRP